jgi:prevent-host-death family protein
MKTYTYSEARQRLAALLEQASREGRVQIRRRNGELFVLQPATVNRWPLDVPSVRANLRPGELTRWIREGRDASAERLLGTALPNPIL